MTVVQNLQARTSYLTQAAENGARLARVAVSFDTTGSGEAVVPFPINFGITYLEAPSVATGFALTTATSRAGAEGLRFANNRHQLVTGKLPNVAGGVWHYNTNSRGQFVAAYIFLVIDSGGQDYALRHFFVFEGDAIKLSGSEFLG